MRTYDVEVSQTVRVTIDETKFDEAFLVEFREDFYPFFSPREHAEHLAQIHARGVVDLEYHNPACAPFVEGYGRIDEMGVKAETIDCNQSIIACTDRGAA